MDFLMDTQSMRKYIDKCDEAGVGPAGLLTKVDRLVTALDYVRLAKTNPSDSARISEIDTAQKRMTTWRVTIRKDKKTATAISMDQERRKDQDIGRMTSILTDTTLFRDFDALRSKRRALTAEELRLATAMASVVLLFSSTQRPSAVVNCTIKEYNERQVVDGVTVISVARHKTSSGGPARLTLGDGSERQLIEGYVEDIRPQIGSGETLLLLPTPSGAKPVEKIGPLITLLEKRYRVQIPTATALRKAVSTQAAKAVTIRSVNYKLLVYLGPTITQFASQGHSV